MTVVPAKVGCLIQADDELRARLPLQLALWPAPVTQSMEELERWLEADDVAAVLMVPDRRRFAPNRIEQLVLAHPHVPWIALAEPDALRSEPLRRLIAVCCLDYHTLPIDILRLRVTVGHAIGLRRLWAERRDHAPPRPFHGIVGESATMLRLFREVRKAAETDAPVLIEGESGTGKELAARAVHRESPRAGGPFVVVNCGALPASLITAELFGYERGAFTGANARRTGRLQLADGGTVFLDEIGDLPLDLQVHLLRFLQEGTIDRLGGRAPERVDVRVIAATHIDLAQAVRQQTFREDLYYRLNVLRLEMPPLRERREDIAVLARFYFERYRRERAPQLRGFGAQALEIMENHGWPGNVRELVNRVRRAVVMGERRLIAPEDLGLERRQRSHRPLVTLEAARREAERSAIMAGLRETGSNVSRAAAQIGVSRVTLYRLMERHRIQLPLAGSTEVRLAGRQRMDGEAWK